MNVFKEASFHLHQMVSLANTLLQESINTSDPIDPPCRTISKEEFVQLYSEHSNALKNLLQSMDVGNYDNVDSLLENSRNELRQKVNKLNEKLDKLNDLRFWMDTTIFDEEGSKAASI